jgi:tetratricopeptide (TPR) repeat protein
MKVWSARLAILVGTLALVGNLAKPARAEPILSTPATGAAAASGQPVEVDDAVKKFNSMDFDGALTALKAAVAKNRDLSPAQVIMARMYAQVNRAAEARMSLERAVLEEPADPEAYVVLATVAIQERRVTEADLLLTYAKSLLDQFEKSPTRKKTLLTLTYAGLAAVAEARGDWSTMKKDLEQWLAIDKTSAVAHQRLAVALFQQKDFSKALEELKAAKDLDPKVLTPEATLAMYYEASGDHSRATEWMDTALKLQPKDFATQMAAAQWAAQTSQFDVARKYADAALALNPNALEAKLVLGMVDLLLKDYPSAEKQFEAALTQAPSNFVASNNLALALCEDSDPAKQRKAVEYAEMNVRQYPKQAEAYSTLGWVYYKNARFKEAGQCLQSALSAGQFSPDTAYYTAKVMLVGDAPEGKKTAKQFLEAALKTKGMFSMRKEAQTLLDTLK